MPPELTLRDFYAAAALTGLLSAGWSALDKMIYSQMYYIADKALEQRDSK